MPELARENVVAISFAAVLAYLAICTLFIKSARQEHLDSRYSWMAGGVLPVFFLAMALLEGLRQPSSPSWLPDQALFWRVAAALAVTLVPVLWLTAVIRAVFGKDSPLRNTLGSIAIVTTRRGFVNLDNDSQQHDYSSTAVLRSSEAQRFARAVKILGDVIYAGRSITSSKYPDVVNWLTGDWLGSDTYLGASTTFEVIGRDDLRLDDPIEVLAGIWGDHWKARAANSEFRSRTIYSTFTLADGTPGAAIAFFEDKLWAPADWRRPPESTILPLQSITV